MSIEAMRQAVEALVQTDTHPISSAKQYLKEMIAMEALEDAIKDAIEQAAKNEFAPDWDTKDVLIERIRELEARQWVGLTDDDYKALQVETLVNNMGYREVLMWADKRLREKNT